jgi:hypothetical protein
MLVSAFVFTGTASAGGFQLSVRTPESTGEGAVRDAVLVVQTYGCHTPADAVVRGVAEGVVNGERRSVKLTLTPASTGVYAIRQQWPAEGTWVLSLSGDYNGLICSVLVHLGENGKVIPGTRLDAGSRNGTNASAVQRKFTAAEIDAALKGKRSVASDRDGRGNALGVAGAGAALSLASLFVLGRRVASSKRSQPSKRQA